MCFWTAEQTPWRQQGQPISLYFKFDVECGKYPGRPCGLFTYQRLAAGTQSESTLIYRFQASSFLCCLWLYLHLKYSFNTARRSFPAQVICSILSKICLCRHPSVSPGMCSRLICPSVIQCHFTSMTDRSATVSAGCIMGSTPGGLLHCVCACLHAILAVCSQPYYFILSEEYIHVVLFICILRPTLILLCPRGVD